MTVSYTGKLAAHEAKFRNVAEKFKRILDLDSENEKKEIFAKSLINPNKALSQDEKSELTSFITEACSKGLKKEFEECKSSTPLKNSLLLLKMKELVSAGLVDVSAYKDKSMSYEEQIEHLEDLLESANDALLYEQKYPEIGEMNTAVKEFRSAVSSLLVEFRDHQERDVKFGADAGKVQESFDADFKSTSDVLKEAWGNSDEEKNTEIALYTSNPVAIHKPNLFDSPRIDSEEAIKNLDTKASYHFTSAIGTMQVTYFKNVALPHLIKGVCKLAKTSSELSSQIQDHIAFNKAKYVMANFKAIFKGISSNYDEDIIKAYEDMQDIRVKSDGVTSYDLDTFFEGVNRVLKVVSFTEQQHDGFNSNIESITDLCPELKFGDSVPLLGMTSAHEDDNADHQEL